MWAAISANPLVISIVGFCGAFFIAFWNRKKNSMDGKLDKDTYYRFTKRIGKEVDDQRDELQKLGKGVAFLIGRTGSDPTKIMS